MYERSWITASVTRPPTVRATMASANRSPRNSAGSVRGSMHVMTYRPLKGRNGKRGVFRHVPLAANALLRSSNGVMFDMPYVRRARSHHGALFQTTSPRFLPTSGHRAGRTRRGTDPASFANVARIRDAALLHR